MIKQEHLRLTRAGIAALLPGEQPRRVAKDELEHGKIGMPVVRTGMPQKAIVILRLHPAEAPRQVSCGEPVDPPR